MLDDFFGNLAGVSADPLRVQFHCSIEAFRFRRWRHRDSWLTNGSLTSDSARSYNLRSADGNGSGGLLRLKLLQGGVGLHEQSVQVVFQQAQVLAETQAAVAVGGLVVAVRIRK